MIYTNAKSYGEEFKPAIDQYFQSSTDVRIASGYVSSHVIEDYARDFIRIGKNGGISQLLLGMAFFEGLSKTIIKTVASLDNTLKKTNVNNGVYVSYSKRYHGKIYEFKKMKTPK